jgi:isocitrate lyase
MPAYVQLQEREFAAEADDYTGVKHQREVGANYFDQLLMAITGGKATTAALHGSTEEKQFRKVRRPA